MKTLHKQVTIICNKKQIQVDKNISSLIKKLNNKKFITLFSCQNNYNQGPYVMIKMPRTQKRIIEFIQIMRKEYPDFGCRFNYNIYKHAFNVQMVKSHKKIGNRLIFENIDIRPYNEHKFLFKNDFLKINV